MREWKLEKHNQNILWNVSFWDCCILHEIKGLFWSLLFQAFALVRLIQLGRCDLDFGRSILEEFILPPNNQVTIVIHLCRAEALWSSDKVGPLVNDPSLVAEVHKRLDHNGFRENLRNRFVGYHDSHSIKVALGEQDQLGIGDVRGAVSVCIVEFILLPVGLRDNRCFVNACSIWGLGSHMYNDSRKSGIRFSFVNGYPPPAIYINVRAMKSTMLC